MKKEKTLPSPSRSLGPSPYQIGRKAEEAAASYYRDQGFQILDQNYRVRRGELDLVVQKGREVRFVEVKDRRSSYYGYAFEAIQARKKKALAYAIRAYLTLHPQMLSQGLDFRLVYLGINLTKMHFEEAVLGLEELGL